MVNTILLILGLTFLTQDIGESAKYHMLLKSMENDSTSPNYILVEVENTSTGASKEICIEYPFFEQALELEHVDKNDSSRTFSAKRLIEKNGSIHFKFSKTKALEILGFKDYNQNELKESDANYNVEDILNENDLSTNFVYGYHGKKEFQKYFVHELLSHGMMVQRGCFAGNILTINRFE